MKFKKSVKITFVIIIVLILLAISIFVYRDKYSYKELVITPNSFEVEVFSKIKLSSLFKDISLKEDIVINTEKVGVQELEFKYIKNKKKYKSKITINVEDNVAPTVFVKTVSTTEGTKIDLINKFIAGDNYDNTPKKEIIGEYDFNKIGTYSLTYKITDSSENETERSFKLIVKERPKTKTTTTSSNNTTNNNRKRTLFSNIVDKHKTSKTMVGIDVSKWQGKIDFEKVSEAGCEFVIIRLGYQKGLHGEMVIDPYFKENIKKAKEAQLKVGVYVYTYASTIEEAKEQASWAIKNLGYYKLDLGISYDWESWSYFNKLNLSFYNFTKVADAFLDYVEKHNNKGFLYSSKYYLENIWVEEKHNIWLAHYTSNTTYKGKYSIWQLCSNGKIDGINGDVDIDIMYLNN